MNSELVGPLEERAKHREDTHASARALVVEALGPLTIVAGIVWAIAQPYRVLFFDHAGKGFYDWLIQPPLLVIAVGLAFALGIAPGLVEDLRRHGGAEG